MCYALRIMILSRLILFSALLSFFGCSHLGGNCHEVNWYEIGRQDSTMGYSLQRSLKERKKVCRLKSESVYIKAYENGFNAGLREYCTFRTGYMYGLARIKERKNSCPRFRSGDFSKGWQAGTRMADIQQLQNQLKEKMSALEELIKNREQFLSSKSAL